MKCVLVALAVFALAGCSGNSSQPSPTTPTPSVLAPTTFDSLSGKVLDNTGVCIEGATVTVVSGQRHGETATQTTDCDAWSYGDDGFEFTGLTPDGTMTLRASATGYLSKERTLRPMDAQGQTVLIALELDKTR